jgi:mono/diheme cytochrome c family protein
MTFWRPLGRFFQLFVCVSAMATVTLPARAAEDIRTGQQIAKHWCASCHIVTLDQHGANTDVPTFFEIARRSAGVADLKAFLADPHPPMPDLNLTHSEIDDLSNYIRSLK